MVVALVCMSVSAICSRSNRTVLRELLQNAADATAKKVTIRFVTVPSTTVPAPVATDATSQLKHVLTNHTLKSMVVTNDGMAFSDNDWARLKRIAEGNPDETKIGAFGVGFYSVFSDCEEPFVSSGSEAMAFYWKGNALFTRRLKMPDQEGSRETNFVLPYRNTTSPVPPMIPLCQFLASSLTFAGLEAVELWLDDWNLLSLKKKVAPGITLNIPRTIETRTKKGLLKVTSITRQIAQMDATVMAAVSWTSTTTQSRNEGVDLAETAKTLRSFFSKLTRTVTEAEDKGSDDLAKQSAAAEDLTATSSTTVFFNITSAQLKSSVSSSFSQELERATKKPPPKTTTLAILTSSYDASTPIASAKDSGKTPNIFASVLPSKGGRVFIGFTTHQTTGLNAHVSAPSLIPTVERESIDLNARWVRDWNYEILRAVGIVCRIAWTAEMGDLKYKLPTATVGGVARAKKEDVARHTPEAVYISNQFVFRESTPSAKVGDTVEDAFWMSDKTGYFEVMSSLGVLPTDQVRLAPKNLSFMEGIAVLPEDLVNDAPLFVKKLTEFGLVTDVTIRDIKRELENNALTSKQLSEFLKWAADRVIGGDYNTQTIQSLLNVAVANEEDAAGNPKGLLILGDIRCYLNPTRIPADMPVPPFTMPFTYTSSLPSKSLLALGWQELEIGTWVQWLIKNARNRSLISADHDMTSCAAFSAKVLPILSKQWETLGPMGKSNVIKLLQENTVLPTKLGMRRPNETYFPSVKLFDDLPVVTGLNGVKEKFLSNLGVRKTVDLGVIFDRLVSDQPAVDEKGRKKWNHVDLVKYFTSVWADIPKNDLLKLKGTRFCSMEPNGKPELENQRYRAAELYEPEPHLKELGFHVIQWPGQFSRSSQEGKFLSMLGLRQYPSPEDLIRVMVDSARNGDMKMRDKALTYYLSHHLEYGYAHYDVSKISSPFLPVEGSSKVASPSKCFTDESVKLFGFDILRRDLHGNASKIGVQAHPPIQICLAVFQANLPKSKSEAKKYFEYFYKRIGDLDSATASRAGATPIVPVRRPTGPTEESKLVYLPPVECYLGDNEDYGDLFDFVDFGSEANLFLMACGSKKEPTKVEVAQLLVKEPARILSKLQTPEKYLNLLRHIAENISLLRRYPQLFAEMKRASFLLGSREVGRPITEKDDDATLVSVDEFDDFEDKDIKEWQLIRASDAIVVDDYSSFSIFKESVLAAPQEEALEQLYLSLGTPYLSSLIEAKPRKGHVMPDQKLAEKLKKQILERSRLFLYDQPRDAVKHDAKWLEKHLIVQNVSAIQYLRVLKGRGIQHNEIRHAIAIPQDKDFVLSISNNRLDWYQISQSLAQIILQRPKLSATLTFEMILKTEIMELKARGYNVERILRAKAAEARIAEGQRQRQLEEEKAAAYEHERAMAQQAAETREVQESMSGMPGQFPGQPIEDKQMTRSGTGIGPGGEEQAMSPREPRTRGLFSGLTDRLKGLAPGNSPGMQPQGQGPTGERSPMTPGALEDNLKSAIQSCRPYGSHSLYSRGEAKEIAETKFYCDEKPSQNLTSIGKVYPGIKVFTTQGGRDTQEFLLRHEIGLKAFSSVLCDCAGVFNLQIQNVNIFHDPGSKSIAFNASGSIFCNYHYFEQLHARKVLNQGQYDTALVYWWVIFCHELAHNIVQDHNSDHSFYT